MYRGAALILLALGSCCGPASNRKKDAPVPRTLVRGTVDIQGQVPKRRILNPKFLVGTPVARLGKFELDNIVVDEKKRVRWALVYVKSGLESRTFDVPAAPAALDLEMYRFVPHVLGLRVGQPLMVANNDQEPHFFHAICEAQPDAFLSGLPAGSTKTVTFGRPEITVRIKCDIHPWEDGRIGVFPHPFYAVTNADGRFEIPGLPPGKYVLEAWHELYIPVTAEIEISEGATVTYDFSLEERT